MTHTYQPRRVRRLLLGAAMFLALVESVTAQHPLRVSGRVVDTRGVAVDGARVRVTYQSDRQQVFLGFTDADGRYTADLSDLRTAVTDTPPPIPTAFRLGNNYPNPFNPATVIPFVLDGPGRVRLTVYNILGQPVRRLLDADLAAGAHRVTWDARDDDSRGLAAGVYLYQVRIGARNPAVVGSGRMTLLDGVHTRPAGAGPLPAQPAYRVLSTADTTGADTLDARHRFEVYIYGDSIDVSRRADITIPADGILDFTVTRAFIVDSAESLRRLLASLPDPGLIPGSLRLVGTDLQDLDLLSGVRGIEASLTVYDNAQLRSLAGLAGLRQLGADLGISTNPQLESLDGLEGLSDIPGSLGIGDHARLTDLSALRHVAAVGGDLGVSGDNVLVHLDGLESIVVVGGQVRIYRNPVLTDVDALGGLRRAAALMVVGNAALQNLDGLGRVPFTDDVWVQDNPALVSLARLRSTIEVANYVTVRGNAALRDLDGLQALRRVGGRLRLLDCARLQDLSALASVRDVGNALEIEDNPSLRSLDGLQGLRTAGALRVVHNPRLQTLAALGGLGPVSGGLSIDDNDSLRSLLGLEGIGRAGTLTVRDNGQLGSLAALTLRDTLGGLSVVGNPRLADLRGLEGIDRIGGFLQVSDCPQLADLRGLDGLRRVDYGVRIYDNPRLAGLDGLGGLQHIEHELDVRRNGRLISLAGLASLTSVEALTLWDNPALPAAAIDTFLDALRRSGFDGRVTRSGNGA